MASSKTAGITGRQADVVVIGGGGAGIPAALAAAELGAERVIVLEKRKAPGGNAIFAAGMLAIESPLQRRLGFDASRDEIFKRIMSYGHWKLNARLVRALVDKAAENVVWLERRGVVFDRLVSFYPNQSPPTYHVISGRESTGAALLKGLLKDCREAGVKILCDCAAEKILTDSEGRVSGVLAATGGKKITIKARSVILATGGMAGNEKLIKKYDPSYAGDEAHIRGVRNTGDGLKMATAAGAAVETPITFERSPNFQGSPRIMLLSRKPYTAWVNALAERFTDENQASLSEAANTIYRQPGRIAYVVFDQGIKDRFAKDVPTPFEELALGEASTADHSLDDDLKRYTGEGQVKIARRLDEIARWIRVTPAALKRTVDEYNSSCDQGHDGLFVKDPRFLIPLRTPPYYAIRFDTAVLVTHGGIRINHRTEVLDRDERPIPGLYAAGIDTGGRESDTYNMYLSGHSFGFSVSAGRIAGEEAANYASVR